MTAVPEPSDALIEAIARAMMGGAAPCEGSIEDARTAYAAMVEHLGLVEQRSDLLWPDNHPPAKRRLVSRWEEEP